MRVCAEADPTRSVQLQRVSLGLAELVVAARLAGNVPLPVGTGTGVASGDRMYDRLAGSTGSESHELLARELARACDEGPDGGRAALSEQGLVDEAGDLIAPVAIALRSLAGGPLSMVLDVVALRQSGEVRLRSWFGIRPGLVSQLSIGSSLEVELGWFDAGSWIPQLTRAVTVEPWAPAQAAMALPEYVQLPSELLAGCNQAHRHHRTDLLSVMADAYRGEVRVGGLGQVGPAEPARVLALLQTLGGGCRGRLRLLARWRNRPGPAAAVAVWLLFDQGWHELAPARVASCVLRRRDPGDLGRFTLPLIDGLASAEAA